METSASHHRLLLSSPLLVLGVGSALALMPLRVSAQSDEASKEKASQSQPSDPVESKEGKLNAAAPGGQVKLTAQEALLVHDFGADNVAEIRMSELALKNAKSEAVKKYAQQMIDAHSKANDELTQVAKNHNLDFLPGPLAKAAEQGEALLNVKGAEFDKKYMLSHNPANEQGSVPSLADSPGGCKRPRNTASGLASATRVIRSGACHQSRRTRHQAEGHQTSRSQAWVRVATTPLSSGTLLTWRVRFRRFV